MSQSYAFAPVANSNGLVAQSIATVATAGLNATGSLPIPTGTLNGLQQQIGVWNPTQYDGHMNVGPAGLAAATATYGWPTPARSMVVITIPSGLTNYSLYLGPNGTGSIEIFLGEGL